MLILYFENVLYGCFVIEIYFYSEKGTLGRSMAVFENLDYDHSRMEAAAMFAEGSTATSILLEY